MSERPHVLLVCTDHWPAELFGGAGHPTVRTPSLDELALCGTRYTNCYSECPVCVPARRSLMTGLSPRGHGDRTMSGRPPLPDVPTLARCFRDAGYQANAVGKLHVWPQRDRIGFDEVLLSEEGRIQDGLLDDYELHLHDRGYGGRYFSHGLSNNQYTTRPWHLPEDCHPTNWATEQMSRQIRRRDPTRPGFWYLSYVHPHPPLTPLRDYWDMYADDEIAMPPCGTWMEDPPGPLRRGRDSWMHSADPRLIRDALRAFYALCTHIDHQLRVVIGTLREEGILEDTIIAFTSDHGDLLGRHGQWAKRSFFEPSTNVPWLLIPPRSMGPFPRTDDRLVGLQDVMPTLLDLCGIPIPEHVEGTSCVGEARREHLYGEFGEGHRATRMIHDGRHKLIYFASGNRFLCFDLAEDPQELRDVHGDPAYAPIVSELKDRLAAELYGDDVGFREDGAWVGAPEPDVPEGPLPSRGFQNQRGTHMPPPTG